MKDLEASDRAVGASAVLIKLWQQRSQRDKNIAVNASARFYIRHLAHITAVPIQIACAIYVDGGR